MAQVVKKTTPRAATPSSRGRVLFVDDERRVLTSMRAMFRKHYDVTLADSGADALEIIKRDEIDVLVSDQRMPAMTGVELLSAVKEVSPDTIRILLTGYADLNAIEASINESEVFRYLVKPCPPDDLKDALALAMKTARDRKREAPSDDASNVVRMPLRARAAEPEPPVLRAVVDEHGPPARPSKPVSKRDIAANAEILLLSNDSDLLRGVSEAVADTRIIHVAPFVRDAFAMLNDFPIGIVITDVAHDEDAITALNETLASAAPDLVMLVASDRSDGPTLIDLINLGHVFRFLLKPVPTAQCRIWIESAAQRHADLALAHGSVRQTEAPAKKERGTLTRLRASFLRALERLKRSKGPRRRGKAP